MTGVAYGFSDGDANNTSLGALCAYLIVLVKACSSLTPNTSVTELWPISMRRCWAGVSATLSNSQTTSPRTAEGGALFAGVGARLARRAFRHQTIAVSTEPCCMAPLSRRYGRDAIRSGRRSRSNLSAFKPLYARSYMPNILPRLNAADVGDTLWQSDNGNEQRVDRQTSINDVSPNISWREHSSPPADVNTLVSFLNDSNITVFVAPANKTACS